MQVSPSFRDGEADGSGDDGHSRVVCCSQIPRGGAGPHSAGPHSGGAPGPVGRQREGGEPRTGTLTVVSPGKKGVRLGSKVRIGWFEQCRQWALRGRAVPRYLDLG